MRLEDATNRADKMTVSEVARHIGRFEGTVRRYLMEGTLIGYKMGRDWFVPYLEDQYGAPVFFYRGHPTGDQEGSSSL